MHQFMTHDEVLLAVFYATTSKSNWGYADCMSVLGDAFT